MDTYLDLRGLKCPLPILRTKKALSTLNSGEIITVFTTDVGAPDDFIAFCQHTGHELLANRVTDDGFTLTIKRK